MKLRVGRKVGRTIYRQLGPEASDEDPLVGMMDTPELAGEVMGRGVMAAEVPKIAALLGSDAAEEPPLA